MNTEVTTGGELTTPIEMPGEFSPNPVISKGDGSPVVFLHGPFGQEWPGYLDDLATDHRVYAPAHPGAEDPTDLTRLDHLWDLVLYYDELFHCLELGRIDLVGHSFGGMVAAEIAATYPDRVRRLVLLDSMGLWLDECPVEEHVTVSPDVLHQLLYANPEAPEVAQRLTAPDDLAAAQAAMVRQFSATAATAHFTHPIPERGLSTRLHRIRAETLLLWGAQDGLVPPIYATEFQRQIADAQVALIDNAGHYPYLEQRIDVSRRTREFLA